MEFQALFTQACEHFAFFACAGELCAFLGKLCALSNELAIRFEYAAAQSGEPVAIGADVVEFHLFVLQCASHLLSLLLDAALEHGATFFDGVDSAKASGNDAFLLIFALAAKPQERFKTECK